MARNDPAVIRARQEREAKRGTRPGRRRTLPDTPANQRKRAYNLRRYHARKAAGNGP